jgi:LPXTG-motif cell wall-anchored protein
VQLRIRLGGLLIAALGIVLLVSGLSTSPAFNVGTAPSPCGGPEVGSLPPCPQGTITFGESDKVIEGTEPTAAPELRHAGRAAALVQTEPTSAPNPPASWTVTVSTDNCTLPNSNATSFTVQVPDQGSQTTMPVELFTDVTQNTSCNYSYVETAVTNWGASFDPAAPQSIPLDPTVVGASHLDVALLNTAYFKPATKPSSKPTKTAKPTPTATHTHSTKPSVKPTVVVTHSSPATLPNTGGAHTRTLAWIGGLLVLVGIWLTVAPTVTGRRRRGRHSA